MKSRKLIINAVIVFALVVLNGCVGAPGRDGYDGQDGQDATVYYSEWFAPSVWSGNAGDWYFEASAPDFTMDIVEGGVVLAYVWLDGDLYESSSVRPLPAYAVGANWSFLIHQYGAIEFTCDMLTKPLTTNKFRFIAIPGTITALKSEKLESERKSELQNMSYHEVCQLYSIPE